MSTCDDIRALLPLFVGGDLEAEQAERVLAHLGRLDPGTVDPVRVTRGSGEPGGGGHAEGSAACRSCLEACEGLRRARERLLELPERSPEPALDLWPAVRERLVAEGLVLVQPGRGRAIEPRLRPAGRLHLWPRLASAAAAGLLIVAGARWLRSEGPEAIVPQPGAPGAGQVAVEVHPLVPVNATGGLRRLEPGELPLAEEALPLIIQPGMGWPHSPILPAAASPRLDPTRPTFASDRALR